MLTIVLLVLSFGVLMSPRRSPWFVACGLLLAMGSFHYAWGGGGDDPVVPPLRTVDDFTRYIIGIAVTAAVGWDAKNAVSLFKSKNTREKVETTLSKYQFEQMIARSAVSYANQLAARALKAGRAKLSGHEKLAAALAYAEQHGLVEDSFGRVAKIIEAVLGEHREFASLSPSAMLAKPETAEPPAAEA